MSFDKLPHGWKFISLEDAMEAIIDYRGKTPKKTKSGIPLVTAKIVKGGYILEPFEFIANDNYDSWMVRGLPKIGDVVLTTEAPLGETAQLTSANVALAQRIVTLRGKKGLLDNDFLLCALQSNFVRHQLESRSSGSTVRGIKQSELRKVSLPVPPLTEQQKIARILKSLSNKLVCNTQTNKTIEAMAQAIFKSWFVDFDPVKAKIRGEQPEGIDANTAALFPDKLVESELGLIPEGWAVQTIKSLSEKISKGTTPSKKDLGIATDEPSIRFLKVRDINDKGEINRDNLEFIPNSIHTTKLKRSILEKQDILFSIAGTIGRVAIVDQDLDNINTNQAVSFIRLKDKEAYLALVYMTLRDSRTQQKAIASVVQGVQANLSLANIGDMEIIVPPEKVLKLWNKQYLSILKMIKNNFSQSRELSSLRDTLLPKLLSGEIELTNKEFTDES
jgi:type I restriction enzyme S subunit